MADNTFVKGTKIKLSATGNYNNGTTKDVSNEVAWQGSSDPTVATNISDGKSSLLKAGSATFQAKLNGISKSITVTVTDS